MANGTLFTQSANPLSTTGGQLYSASAPGVTPASPFAPGYMPPVTTTPPQPAKTTEPTVVSSAGAQDKIDQTTSGLAGYTQPGQTIDTSSGSPITLNADRSPAEAPSDAVQITDAQGNTMWKDSAGKTYALGSGASNLTGVAKTSYDQLTQIQGEMDALGVQQIQNIKDQYAQLIQQQEQTNRAGAASTYSLLARGGSLQTESAGGILQTQVSYGAQQIADLTNKQATAINAAQVAMKNFDYQVATKQYDIAQKAAKDRQDAVQKVQDAIDAAKKQVQDNQKAVDTQIRSLMGEAAKGGALTPDQQSAFQTALANHDYSAAVAAGGDNLANASGDIGEYNLAKRQGFIGSFLDYLRAKTTATTKPTAGVAGDMTGLPASFQAAAGAGATGASLIASLPPIDRATIQAVLDYTKDPKNLSLRKAAGETQSEREKFLSMAHMIDPTYDESQYPVRAAVRKSFTSGQDAKNLTSLNTAVKHLDSLKTAADALNNAPLPLWNTIANIGIASVGDPRVAKFNTAATAVENELANVFKGTGATDQEIKAWKENINSSQSPDQLKGAIDSAIELMSGRLSALSSKYSEGMGKPVDFNMLSTDSQKILTKMGYDPMQIDPSLSTANPDVSAVVQGQQATDASISAYGDANPSDRATISRMRADGRTPEEIQSWINSK